MIHKKMISPKLCIQYKPNRFNGPVKNIGAGDKNRSLESICQVGDIADVMLIILNKSVIIKIGVVK